MKKRWFLRRKAQQNAGLETNENADMTVASSADETAEKASVEVEETPKDNTQTGLVTIQTFTESEGVEVRNNVSLREILGGDILMNGWLKKQMGLILMCVFFAILYITNRYSSQQEIIEIEKLRTQLNELRYYALTRSSELTVKTRQSQVEASLRHTADSVLATPKEPPFIIKQNKEEE